MTDTCLDKRFFGKAAHHPLFGGYGFSITNGLPVIVEVSALLRKAQHSSSTRFTLSILVLPAPASSRQGSLPVVS